jgi:hypothetical protein
MRFSEMELGKANSFRPQAVFLVVASGVTLLFLSAAFQYAVWECRSFYRLRGMRPPLWSDMFLDMFGHRPDAYPVAVILWLWWPMVPALIYTHFRWRDSRYFPLEFLYWFSCCWLFAASVLAFMALLCVLPMLELLEADLNRI